MRQMSELFTSAMFCFLYTRLRGGVHRGQQEQFGFQFLFRPQTSTSKKDHIFSKDVNRKLTIDPASGLDFEALIVSGFNQGIS